LPPRDRETSCVEHVIVGRDNHAVQFSFFQERLATGGIVTQGFDVGQEEKSRLPPRILTFIRSFEVPKLLSRLVVG
jgi:hypothetical protein